MNQIKIGEFIASARKAKNLTQVSLAEKLGITDRAVSKWERGRGLPEVSLMIELCDILGVTVNELLNGERIKEEKEEKSEQLLLSLAKEVEEKNHLIWTSMWVIMIVCCASFFASIFLIAFLIPEGPWQGIAIIGATLLFFPSLFFALKLEVSVGVYKCKKCGCEIKPTSKEVISLKAMHMGFTRYLHCPKCNKRRWCKKIIKK